jgi:hypothetical protein
MSRNSQFAVILAACIGFVLGFVIGVAVCAPR